MPFNKPPTSREIALLIVAILLAILLIVCWQRTRDGDYDIVCSAPEPSAPAADQPTLSSAGNPMTEALHSDESTGCDEAANRSLDENEIHDEYHRKRNESFPDNVIAHPEECVNPSRLAAVDQRNDPGTPASAQPDPFTAMYLDDELLTYLDPELVFDAVAEIARVTNQPTLEVRLAGPIDGEIDRIRVEGAATLEGSYPATLVTGIENEVLYRLKIVRNEDLGGFEFDATDDTFEGGRTETTEGEEREPIPEPGPSVDGVFDPLVLSNLLSSNGLLVRPNYVAARTPGSQHSPANGPAPASADRLLQPDLNLGDERFSVAVLDSDANYPEDPMRFSAGHQTFVVGVIKQLTRNAIITEIGFEAGSDIGETKDPTDWDLLRTVTEYGLATRDYRVVNMSLGAYSCPPPPGEAEVDPGQLPHVPLGLVGIMASLKQSDVLVVAAAGNDGVDEPFWPAALADLEIEGSNVIAVKALAADTTKLASFSNTLPGNAACALGVDVLSAYPSGFYEYPNGKHGEFKGAATWSGTSFATPHIAAEYVNMLARNPSLSMEDAVDALRELNCP